MPNDRKHFRTIGLIALAAVLGLAAGGFAVYVKGDLSGNNAVASSAVNEAADSRCAAKAGAAKALGAAATGDVAAMLAADPPRNLSRLAFDGPDGERLSVADFSGKTLILNLWATWCAPCRAEMPALDALQAKRSEERV